MRVKALLMGPLLLLAGFYFPAPVLTQEVMPFTGLVGRVSASGDSYYMKLAFPAAELKTENPVYTVGEEVIISLRCNLSFALVEQELPIEII
jgi:hypothetical protein